MRQYSEGTTTTMASDSGPVNECAVESGKRSDRDDIWADLLEGMKQAYTCSRAGMSRSRYMQLYDCVRQYMSGPPWSSVPLFQRIRRPRDNLDKSLFVELYSRIAAFLESHLQSLSSDGTFLVGEDFLRFYVRAWEEYKISSRVLDGICSFINRTWVKRMRAINSKQFVEIYYLAIISWKRCLCSALNDQLTSSVLRLIEKWRNGDDIDTTLLTLALSSYVEIGIDEENPTANSACLSVYKATFEDAFLEASELFYRRATSDYLRCNSVMEYVKRVYVCLSDEKRMVMLCMHESTLQPLVKVCEKVLIEEHLDVFCEEFQNLLKSQWQCQIGEIFQLVSRASYGVRRLRECFEKHVVADGCSTMEILGNKAFHDPVLYVETLLKIHNKYRELITTEFASHADFIFSLDKACENLVNNNAVTKRVNSSEKSSELLVQYCCGLLNKAYDNQNTSDIQDDLDKVIVLFKYIKDKDTFEKLYSKMLADRLVNQTSISHEVEISMISRFKQSCGINYTSKLERMLQDVRLSRDLNGEFTKQVTGGSVSIGFQFIPMVLTAGWWPFEEPSATCSLPQELCQSVQWFTAFYFCKHNARKLTWLHSICRGELTTSCFKNSHIIQASMFQMVVLLEFNIALSFSIQQLHESTDIRMDTLIEVVKTLLKNRLLVTPENGREDPSSLATCQPGTIVSLNDNYSNKKVHVNISVPVRASEEAEQAASRKAVELDRKLGIQAAIVRIMKARKTLEHRELVAEVLRQLSSLFTPDVLAIKAGIDKMIEREYIERAEGQSDVYKYVA